MKPTTSTKLILISFVLVGPLLDLLNGYFILKLGWSSLFTPGVIYRGFFLTVVFIILTYRYRSNIRHLCLYFLGVFFLANFLFYPDYDVELVRGLSRFLKILFPVAGLGAMVYINRNTEGIDRFLWRIGGWYGVIVALSIVILYITGYHVPSYERQEFSSKGVFKAQNDTGVVLILALTMSLYYNYVYKNNNPIYLFSTVALYLAGGLLLSTRAAIAGVPAVILLFYLFVFFSGNQHRGMGHRIYILTLLGGLAIAGFHIFRLWLQQDVGYTVRRFRLLFELWAFRRKVPQAVEQISNFSVAEHLFGVGELRLALTENDIVDIYGKFGLTTLIPLLIFFSGYYFRLFSRFIVKRALSTFVLLVCFTFYIAHASLAGHALTSAPVNNLFMLAYYLAYREVQGIADCRL